MYGLAYSFSKDDGGRNYAIQQLKGLQFNPAAQAARVQTEAPPQFIFLENKKMSEELLTSCLSIFTIKKSFLGKLVEMW